jgi:exopolysaccharide biosynthesis polyprenyl glycosylphosphotransferase
MNVSIADRKHKPQKSPLSDKWTAFLLFILDLTALDLSYTIGLMFFGKSATADFFISSIYFTSFFTVFFSLYIFDLYAPGRDVHFLKSLGRSLLAILLAFILFFILYHMLDLELPYQLPKKFWVFSWFGMFIFVASIRSFFSHKFQHKASEFQWIILTDQGMLLPLKKDLLSFARLKNISFLVRDAKTEIDYEKWEELEKYITNDTGGVIVASSRGVPDDILEILMRLRLEGVRVYDLADFYEKFLNQVPVFHLKSGWFIFSSGFMLIHNIYGWRIKKLGDYSFALLSILLLSPLLLLLSLLIKLESKGPVIFQQKRVGQNEKEFMLYKFRTMRDGSEKGDKYTQENDSRITRFGKILRKTRLDELPQLINILKGEMSLIGPRAEWIDLTKNYEKEIPYYHLRHLVKPGITGWAQVLYPYGSSIDDAQKKLQYDLYYIKRYSILLDWSIVLKTIRVMLFGKGM